MKLMESLRRLQSWTTSATSSLRRGFSLTELIIAVIISAILFAGSVPLLNVQLKNSRIDTVEGNLVIFKSDMEAYLEDYGVFALDIDVDKSNNARKEKITAFLNKLSKDYMHVTFNTETLFISDGSFKVQTQTEDPWGVPYTMYYNYNVDSATAGTVILASNGPDVESSYETYATGEFGDDVLVIVVPKIAAVAS